MAKSKKPIRVTKALAEFLKHNTHSSISEEVTPVGKEVVVKTPWNDESVAIVIENLNDPAISALNNVYLPERFTGLWHRDTKDFEIIWTAFPLTGSRADVKDRSFTYRHSGKSYECEFAKSSDRLLAIAKFALPIGPQTETGYRNLQSFGLYTRRGGGGVPRMPLTSTPYCFWIRNVDWNDDKMLSLALHLNFYLSYYDAMSPRIQINTLKVDKQSSQPRTRYTTGKFPKHISSKNLDDELLLFWLAAHDGNSGHRLTYCYRILEYVCHTYLEATVRRKVRQILEAPDALDAVPKVVEESVVTLLGYLKDTNDGQRIEQFLREVVSPKLLWREIQANRESFTKDISFTGGEVIKALPAECMTADGFAKTGIHEFCERARRIRNALSHGREHRQLTFIAPTTRNFERLSPWVTLMMVAAGEAILRRRSL